MSKIILIAIVVILLVVVILGIYIIFSYNEVVAPVGNSVGNQNTNATNFEIQGVKVEILNQGSGVGTKENDYVTTHYIGVLEDGREFDSSISRNSPFTFQLGQNTVIKGFDLGVLGMKVGEKRRITIPPELAYGLDGFPPKIPEKANLIYVIDLLKINPTEQQ